ncbi:MAG: hypothetical protein GF346_04855, partial [Candidatus Eisenbacteria bacterium]|nr:hypothetical protein [Candidatus Latescibacterota bacterium]MBD3301756.1 hypothetical protein [Candidatus Eisenbacteria bacterium]
ARIRVVRPGDPPTPQGIAERIGGALAFDARLGGTGAIPEAVVHARIDDLHLYRARADSVIGLVRVRPDALVLERLDWLREGNASRAEGSYPIRLSLVPGRTRVDPQGPVRLDADLPEIDLGIVRAISRDIVDPEGTLSGRVALRGTPERTWPEGTVTIREGGMRIPNREERLREIEARITLDSSGVVIEEARGRVGEDGRIEARGTFRDLASFDLEAEVRDAVVFETGLYHFTADGDFRAFPVEEDEEQVPLIVGTVEVQEGAIVGDLAKAPAPPSGSVREPSPWRAEIDIFAPGNIRLQTAVASVDLGEAENLHVSFDDPRLNISGGIQVLGGRYRVFNNIFTIRSGSVEFRDTGRGVVEPILDVYAETQVRVWTADQQEAETETIEIHVTGPVTELNLDFASESDRSTEEIIALLSIGRLRDETGGIGVTSSSRDYLLTEAVSQIESQISQLIGPLQNVTVLPGEEPGGAWQLNVRQTILPQVSLAYTRELASTAGQEVSVQYNLGGQLYLNAAVETRQEEGAPAERYSLDLKLRFEYR